ncbi:MULTISPECIES: DUF6342 family protein [unclassified Streptomyces]|uniref:DUF6342 family protein n=1 Tax=unclassified Streptomyces TaxID=2593676 RepID=UPI0016612F56|nr:MULTISPECIES: DUF6342 family protein [unclassified Streptomyces]MBD0707234.1 hypothetical protein [Streptomyces sp. CBMA291]MBD0713722.1 hypothetical protein [Streptomyces sp. CBMA370]
MADIDLGQASDWNEGDNHARISLTPSRVYPGTDKKDLVIGSPVSIELSVNTNHSSSQEADKVYFTTYHGSTKKLIAVLDSDGNLSIAGRLTVEQKDLKY